MGVAKEFGSLIVEGEFLDERFGIGCKKLSVYVKV